MNNEMQDKLSELIKNMPVEMNIFEEGIDYTLIEDFYITVKQVRNKKNENKEEEEELEYLSFDWQQLPDDVSRKNALARCALLGSVESFRKIEDFLTGASSEMRRWAQLALLHCRLNLENDLLDQPVGYIASGLGGKGNKLRYYFAIISEQPPTESMAVIVSDSYQQLCAEYDVEIEEVITGENYFLIRILGPFGDAISNFIESGIEPYDFLLPYYYVTNMRKPSEEDIQAWITHCKEDDEDTENEDDSENPYNYDIDDDEDDDDNYNKYDNKKNNDYNDN